VKVDEQFRDGVLTLRVAEKALVKRPEWDRVAGLRRPDASVVVVDLKDVDFISSLFLHGCVELNRSLAASGVHLVLLHLSPSKRAVLELVAGAAGLLMAKDERELSETVAALAGPVVRDGRDEGVARAEKRALWS
jgi:hypothetical protein